MPRADYPERSDCQAIVTLAPHASSGRGSVHNLNDRDNDLRTMRATPAFCGRVLARSHGRYFHFPET